MYGTCADTASIISQELMQLPHLRTVAVDGRSSGVSDEGCIWEIALLSVMGNPDLFEGEFQRIRQNIQAL